MMSHPQVHNTKSDETGGTQAAEKGIISTLLEHAGIVIVIILVAIFLKTFIVDAYHIPSASMENTLDIGDFIFVNKLAYGLRTPQYIPFTNLSLPHITIPLFGSVHRGDVIVFEFPGYRNEIRASEPINFVKRCIGLPGDDVEIKDGTVIINGEKTPFPPTGKKTGVYNRNLMNEGIFPEGSGFSGTDYGPIRVPKKNDLLEINTSNIGRWRIFIEREGHEVNVEDGTILIDGKASASYRIERDYYFVLGDNRNNSLDSRYWGFVPAGNVIGKALIIYWSWDRDYSKAGFPAIFSAIQWDRIGKLIR
jgi:signal peptidase I